MDINRIPGAVWPILYGAIYLGLQTFVSAQWPDVPPAAVLGIMAALGTLQGLVKVLWPAPDVPLSDGAAMPRGVAADVVPKSEPGKVSRFFV